MSEVFTLRSQPPNNLGANPVSSYLLDGPCCPIHSTTIHGFAHGFLTSVTGDSNPTHHVHILPRITVGDVAHVLCRDQASRRRPLRKRFQAWTQHRQEARPESRRPRSTTTMLLLTQQSSSSRLSGPSWLPWRGYQSASFAKPRRFSR